MHKLTISRAEFQAAIEAGIEAAPRLPDDVVAKLYRLGRRARTVTGNFHGCPLSRVTSYEKAARGLVPGGASFVQAYDQHIITRTNAGEAWVTYMGDVVTSKHGEEIYFIKD